MELELQEYYNPGRGQANRVEGMDLKVTRNLILAGVGAIGVLVVHALAG
jgi:hypothetical protein